MVLIYAVSNLFYIIISNSNKLHLCLLFVIFFVENETDSNATETPPLQLVNTPKSVGVPPVNGLPSNSLHSVLFA